MIFETALVCLALNIYHEARGEPIEGKRAVASVTLNRVRDSRFPSTVCTVVKQQSRNPSHPHACAFSWYCDGRSDKPRGRAWIQALHIAYDAITGEFGDNTGGALWYHHINSRPIWRSRLDGKRIIGNHVFYNIRRTGTRF